LARLELLWSIVRDREVGAGTHLVEPDPRKTTSHGRFAGGLSKAGSATYQTVAAARPMTRARSASTPLRPNGRSFVTAASGSPYTGVGESRAGCRVSVVFFPS
jgi:hypothetical protein